jgi:1-hydroxycarotenoid 3,4-desaturase
MSSWWGPGSAGWPLRCAWPGRLRRDVSRRSAGPGGKMRPRDSVAGPVDTGPTVLTLRHVFDDLFDAAGERLEDHLRLIPLPCLARHLWDDGTVFDLMADPDATRANLRAAFGAGAVADHDAFTPAPGGCLPPSTRR